MDLAEAGATNLTVGMAAGSATVGDIGTMTTTLRRHHDALAAVVLLFKKATTMRATKTMTTTLRRRHHDALAAVVTIWRRTKGAIFRFRAETFLTEVGVRAVSLRRLDILEGEEEREVIMADGATVGSGVHVCQLQRRGISMPRRAG